MLTPTASGGPMPFGLDPGAGLLSWARLHNHSVCPQHPAKFASSPRATRRLACKSHSQVCVTGPPAHGHQHCCPRRKGPALDPAQVGRAGTGGTEGPGFRTITRVPAASEDSGLPGDLDRVCPAVTVFLGGLQWRGRGRQGGRIPVVGSGAFWGVSGAWLACGLRGLRTWVPQNRLKSRIL